MGKMDWKEMHQNAKSGTWVPFLFLKISYYKHHYFMSSYNLRNYTSSFFNIAIF